MISIFYSQSTKYLKYLAKNPTTYFIKIIGFWPVVNMRLRTARSASLHMVIRGISELQDAVVRSIPQWSTTKHRRYFGSIHRCHATNTIFQRNAYNTSWFQIKKIVNAMLRTFVSVKPNRSTAQCTAYKSKGSFESWEKS